MLHHISEGMGHPWMQFRCRVPWDVSPVVLKGHNIQLGESLLGAIGKYTQNRMHGNVSLGNKSSTGVKTKTEATFL